MKKLVVLLALTLVLSAVATGSATACTPSLSVSPQQSYGVTMVSGLGFTPNSTVTLAYDGALLSTVPMVLLTDVNGDFNGIIVAPAAEPNYSVSFNVTDGGSDYTTPHVVISGGGGSGATATARVSQGVVFDVVLTNLGSGYTSAPTVSLSDPSPRARGADVAVSFQLYTLTYPVPGNHAILAVDSENYSAVTLFTLLDNKGDSGMNGAAGVNGTNGVNGLNGVGVNGTNGKDGVGVNGTNGVDGKSIVGPQGLQGIQGAKGDAGLTGVQGQTGPSGVKGDKGDTGETGIQGLPGESGAQGEQGLVADNFYGYYLLFMGLGLAIFGSVALIVAYKVRSKPKTP